MLSCKGWLPWRLAYLSRMAGLAAVLTQMCLLQTSDTPTACCVPAEVMGQAFKELQQEKGWKREEIVFSTKVCTGAS